MINNIDRLVEYKNNIEYSSADYIEGLLNKDDIYHTNIFNGMIKQIYIDVFKNNPLNFNNSNDISLINDLWDIYSMLCYKYKQIPNILRFNTLLNCGITMNKIQKIYSEYVNNIDNNNYAANSSIIDDININTKCSNDSSNNCNSSINNYSSNSNSNHKEDNSINSMYSNNSNNNCNSMYNNNYNSNNVYNNANNVYDNSNVNNIRSLYYQLSEKILNECEAGAYDLATTGNKVGGMFALKTQYGYAEATQPVHIKTETRNVLTELELKQLINKLK